MNSIFNDQNKPEMIRLLKAKSVAYDHAKQVQLIEWIAQISALITPVVGIFALPDIYEKWAGVIATIILLFNGATYLLGKRRTDEGANIQEQFDSQLFKLEWNEILCGEKVHLNEIVNLAKRYPNDNNQDNWYSKEVVPSVRHSNAVLLCQDSNLIWDMDLRKRFRGHLIAFVVLYYSAFLIYLAYQNYSFNHSLILLSPSASFLVFGFINIINISGIITDKRNLSSKIKSLFERFKQTRQEASTPELRNIQDVMFATRKSPEKIPDWYYNLFRKAQEETMDECVRATRDQYDLTA